MNKKALIDTLNNLNVGELATLERRLAEVRREVAEQGLDEITTILGEAQDQLDACDLKAFRKKLQHAVSRLGHVRPGERPLATKLPAHLRKDN